MKAGREKTEEGGRGRKREERMKEEEKKKVVASYINGMPKAILTLGRNVPETAR